MSKMMELEKDNPQNISILRLFPPSVFELNSKLRISIIIIIPGQTILLYKSTKGPPLDT